MPIPVPVRVVRWIKTVKRKISESMKATEYLSIRSKLLAAVNIIEGFLTGIVLKELEIVAATLKPKLLAIESLVTSEYLKLRLKAKASISYIEKLVINIILGEIVAIGQTIKLKLKALESTSASEYLEILVKLNRNVSISDVIGKMLLRLKEYSTASTKLQARLSNLMENIGLSDSVKMKLKVSQSVSSLEDLYYEVYPYEYSLDVVAGYPSKTFPSLDITSTEVKTYGEVTVA